IPRLRGRTFGVLGMGRIGTAAARRAAAFGLRVVFYDPYLPDGAELGLGYERVDSTAALAAQADVLSLHAPHTEETHNIVNAAMRGAMRPTAVLVNTAGGALVALDALTAALEGGRIAGAALDVLPEEPPVSGHRLLRAVSAREPWTTGRVVITPH